jgi:hypothetical protein
VQEAVIDRYGLQNDRRRMVVDSGGRFLTQREIPRMAAISTRIADGAPLEPSSGRPAEQATIRAPGRPPLLLPDPEARGLARRVRIWNDECVAVDEGDRAAAWMSHYLDVPCRLVRMDVAFVRQADAAYARPGDQVGFMDGFPILLLSEESLDDLNGRLAVPIPMNRFRPNMVVRGAGRPFAEDEWRTLRQRRTGDNFHIVKPCARCAIPTIDQNTGKREGPEPLAALNAYRKQGNRVLFGQNVIHDWQGSLMHLRIGDELDVTCLQCPDSDRI